MSGYDEVESMPRDVSVARAIMWVQAGLGVIALLFLIIFLSEVPAEADLGPTGLLLFLPTTVTTVLLAVLASAVRSRRKWVRITALVVQGLGLLGPLITTASGESVTVFNLLGMLLPLVVIWMLARSASAEWFNR
ncbi:hypothetical protein SAMN05421505_103202 [Sinosporangium album]|uniref:Integral membrane protein n=1 Tax=Sinosporangium album TaxID=504805 RepID=A0A1G7TCG7_9ACTN|nr:hypothetical protein [Sinosporangium album]SDG32734.1 hypothetical protein SAMN05421505_103202 [Sinosporangium album]